MYFYRLGRRPPEWCGEGEDHDEWFASLKEAKKKRAILIKEDPFLDGHPLGSDYEIDKVTLVDLPNKALVQQVLNGFGYISLVVQIVGRYIPPPKKQEEDEDES